VGFFYFLNFANNVWGFIPCQKERWNYNMGYTHHDGIDAKNFKINGTQVTATAAQLNKTAVTTAGTAEASKALILGANKNIDVLAVADLKLGAGAGTSVSATAAEINRACDVSARVVTVATTPLAITTDAHDGKVIVLTKADDQAVTLPAATGSGTMLKFIQGIAVTGGKHTTINTSALDQVLIGNAILLADGGDTVVAFEAASTANGISFDGSTTGGLKGDSVELIDVATKTWFVKIVAAATGSEATPFVTRS